MKNRKVFIGTTGILCIIFCLFLPFYFGLQFLLPKLMPQEISSEVSEDILTPDECSPFEAWKHCEDALASIGSFSSVSEGTVDTQVLFFNYQQQIANYRVVSDKTVFLQSMNTGALLNAGLQQYFDGSKAYLRPCQLVGSNHFTWAETPSVVSMSAYYDAFGPVTDGLSPFLLNERTLVTAFFLYENDGVYSFSFELSPEAAIYYARALRASCQLESDPVFSSVEIKLDMDAEFRPIRIEYEENYTISMDLIGDTTCKAKYVETFLLEEASLNEQSYYESFSSMEASNTVPALSTGYNFLFSLFGNTNTYDGTMTLSGEEFSLLVSLDNQDKSIYATGENFSFVYSDQHYYFHLGDNKLFSDAEAFNNKIGPLASIGNASNNERINLTSPRDSFTDGLDVKTEQGKLIVSSSSDEFSFSVTMDTATMLVETLSVEFSAAGETGSLRLVQSDLKGEKPSLHGYTNVTPALDSMDILLELAQQPNTYYHAQIQGDRVIDAEVTLTLGETPSIHAVLVGDLPVQLFYSGDSLSAVYNDITFSGTPSEFESFLTLFGENEPTVLSAAEPTFGLGNISEMQIAVAGSNLVLRFGEDLRQKITLYGDSFTFEDSSTAIYVLKIGHGEEPAAKAPLTKHTVAISDLCSFLEGSVYPKLLRSETIYAKLDIRSPEGRFDMDAMLSVSPEVVARLDTDLYGEPIRLYYKDDTLYLSHKLFNAFVPVDGMSSLFSGNAEDGNSGNTASAPAEGEELRSIQVESHQIKLVFETQTLFLTKESFRLTGDGTSVRSTKLRGEDTFVFIDVPAKKSCIDLVDLTHKFSCLEEQTRFSFTGSYSNDMIAAVISRLDIRLTEDGEVAELATEAIVSNTISQLVKIFYNSDALYMDLGGLKLYAETGYFYEQSVALHEETDTKAPAMADLFQSLSTIESISYIDGTLTVATGEAVFSIGWLGDEINVVRYKTKNTQLLLVKCEERPIVMPAKEEYTDITPLNDLLKALFNTIGSQSLRFEGEFDLKVFSHTLENIKASGVFSTRDGSISADLYFTVPYVTGISSANIPSRHAGKPLKDCTILNRVIICDETIYITKTISCEYGTVDPKSLVFSEKRFVTLREFQNDPTKTFNFVFNLETDLPDKEIPDPEPDNGETNPDPIFSESPIKDAYKEEDYFVLEFSQNILPDSTDDLVFRVYTDGQYIHKLNAISHISVFTIEGSIDIFDHGTAQVPPPDKSSLDEYLPLRG